MWVPMSVVIAAYWKKCTTPGGQSPDVQNDPHALNLRPSGMWGGEFKGHGYRI